MSNLIPPDDNQCQCMITAAYSPFVLGPKPRAKRCTKKPVWLAVEYKRGEDGLYGSMSLCHPCAKELLENKSLRNRIQLQPLYEF